MNNKNVIHAVIMEWPDGGQQLNCFIKKESAIEEITKLKNVISTNPNNLKIYLTCLNYDFRKNLIVGSKWINEGTIQYI